MKRLFYPVICVYLAAVLIVLLKSSYAGDVTRITKQELNKKLCSSELILLDVRTVRSWDKSTQKIKCSKRVDPDNISSWASTLPKDKEIVLYCSWTNEYTSARVAQELMGKGFTMVKALKGGWNEWVESKYPVENK